MYDELFNSGYGVFRKAISHPAISTTINELVIWLSDGKVWKSETEIHEEFRYCHAPHFQKSAALNELSEEMRKLVELVFGEGNAKGRPLQLLGTLDGQPTEPRHKERHIDNVPNAADEAKKRADEKRIHHLLEPLDYPRFNAIVCLALTDTWVRIWPESHKAVAAYYSQAGAPYDLVKSINSELVKIYPGDGVVVKLDEGDVLIMNHLLIHDATEHDRVQNPRYSVPGKGGLSARLYQRFETVNPPPVGWSAMRMPWFGCHGVMDGR